MSVAIHRVPKPCCNSLSVLVTFLKGVIQFKRGEFHSIKLTYLGKWSWSFYRDHNTSSMQFKCILHFYIQIYWSQIHARCHICLYQSLRNLQLNYFSLDDFQEFNVKQALSKLGHWAFHIYNFFHHKKCKSSLTLLVLSHSQLLLNILTIIFSAAVRNIHMHALYFFQRCSSIELVLFSANIGAIKSCLIQFTSFLPSPPFFPFLQPYPPPCSWVGRFMGRLAF